MHPRTYFVDESVKISDGTEICALIAVKTIDSSKLTTLITSSIDKILSDQVLSQHNGMNANWIPHYCNDHPIEVHPQFLRDMARMPFEAYIVFGNKKSFPQEDEYCWYDNLMKILFTFRLSADKGCMNRIVYEQHDSKIAKRESYLQSMFDDMSKKDARRRRTEPSSISVESAGKDVLPLCLPDYIGGSFMSYLCATDSELKPKRREFELIAKKVRWIKNVDTNKIFTSRQPFQKY